MVIAGNNLCTDPSVDSDERMGSASRERLVAWSQRWQELRESVDSEWSAACEALSAPGTDSARKWLGWALYRLAARVNPEVRDQDPDPRAE